MVSFAFKLSSCQCNFTSLWSHFRRSHYTSSFCSASDLCNWNGQLWSIFTGFSVDFCQRPRKKISAQKWFHDSKKPKRFNAKDFMQLSGGEKKKQHWESKNVKRQRNQLGSAKSVNWWRSEAVRKRWRRRELWNWLGILSFTFLRSRGWMEEKLLETIKTKTCEQRHRALLILIAVNLFLQLEISYLWFFELQLLMWR